MIYELVENDRGIGCKFTLGLFDTLAKAEKARKIASDYYEDKGDILVTIVAMEINILQGESFEDLGPIKIEEPI